MSEHTTRLAVVMAGGSGERFWPLSREHRPKQLLKLSSPTATMLEEAVDRIAPLCGRENIYISTSAKLSPHIAAAHVVPADQILAEPLKRNTLGALVWSVACLLAEGHGTDASVAILTADHKIAPPEDFLSCVEDALQIAESGGGLVTIGIQPDRPETGYGYIEVDPNQTRGAGFAAKSFREKPDLITAESFLDAGTFLWNSGMFFFTLGGFIEALQETQPDAHKTMFVIVEALKSEDDDAATAAFGSLPNLSIDYAVMERASKVSIIASRFEWDDLGAWDALERSMPLNESRSVDQGETILIDTHDSIIYNDSDHWTVAVLGMRDVIVVCAGDAILVCPKTHAQRVKEIVKVIADRQQS